MRQATNAVAQHLAFVDEGGQIGRTPEQRRAQQRSEQNAGYIQHANMTNSQQQRLLLLTRQREAEQAIQVAEYGAVSSQEGLYQDSQNYQDYYQDEDFGGAL